MDRAMGLKGCIPECLKEKIQVDMWKQSESENFWAE